MSDDAREPIDTGAYGVPDEKRRCDDCGRETYDVRRRIGRNGAPLQCRACFERKETTR